MKNLITLFILVFIFLSSKGQMHQAIELIGMTEKEIFDNQSRLGITLKERGDHVLHFSFGTIDIQAVFNRENVVSWVCVSSNNALVPMFMKRMLNSGKEINSFKIDDNNWLVGDNFQYKSTFEYRKNWNGESNYLFFVFSDIR